MSEPRLSETDHSYLACMPSAFDGLVQVSMDGTPGVYTELRWGFETDGCKSRRGSMSALAGLNIGLGPALIMRGFTVTLDELRAKLDKLKSARYTGVRRIVYSGTA